MNTSISLGGKINWLKSKIEIVEVKGTNPVPTTMRLNTLYEDATLQVVEKTAGIDIKKVQSFLQEGFSPAHRLDKDTSGLLLIAKTKDTLE